MALTGNLETFYLTTILQLLHTDHKTGILRVTHNSEEIKVYIQEGAIIHATRSQEKNRLGDLLVKHGIITEKQLKDCLKYSQEKKLPLGKIVVQKGYADAPSLKKSSSNRPKMRYMIYFYGKKGNSNMRTCHLPPREW